MEKSTLDDAMEKVRQFPSTANFQDLIQKLKERLSDDSPEPEGLSEEPFHTHPSSGILDPKQHQEHQSHPPTHHEQDSGGGGAASNMGKSLNSDTIILMVSLIVMILLGLLFHRVITYFAKLRSRRRQYHKGLKQLGEHMHVVTRTISSEPPSGASTPAAGLTPVSTPAIAMRKLAAINSNKAKSGSNLSRKIPDDDNSVFKPSTHVMRREDSDLGVMTTATELRHKQEIEELHCIEELHSRE